MGPDALALVPAAPEHTRNGDAGYAYRADSDLLYLTGHTEPDALAVISTASEQDFVLFLRPRDAFAETWSGRRLGLEGAVARLGAAAAHPFDEWEALLPAMLADVGTLYVKLGAQPAFDQKLVALLGAMRSRAKWKGHPPGRIEDLGEPLHELRLFKSDAELALLERAAHVTDLAHRACMSELRPGMKEYELQATLEYQFRKHGCEPGYVPIVAADANATVLHYHQGRDALVNGGLVLIDAGAEHEGYTADVTRTLPVGGAFSAAQRDVYDLVLKAQAAALALCKPGSTIPQIHAETSRVLAQGLIDLGLLTGDVDEVLREGKQRRYYMHGTNHYLGLDVHDVGRYGHKGKPRPLEPGMVITVEPGLYVPQEGVVGPEALRGVGVRIEDDVLITASGHRNLTAATPKAREEIEARCAR
jgi:Xaa-Pro aminopeptidase